ncbi:MAG: DUF2784 family protein [Streptosporangiales bacterium]|nr:DUF2784 family protein [Streptosporangiales bacterium]
MLFRWAAIAVACLHAAYLVYVVVGGFVVWRFPRTFLVHVVAAVWALVVVAASLPCPLTTLQNMLRVQGGQSPLQRSFLDTYVRDVVYPAEYQNTIYVAAAAAVAVSWLGLAFRQYRRVKATRHP